MDCNNSRMGITVMISDSVAAITESFAAINQRATAKTAKMTAKTRTTVTTMTARGSILKKKCSLQKEVEKHKATLAEYQCC